MNWKSVIEGYAVNGIPHTQEPPSIRPHSRQTKQTVHHTTDDTASTTQTNTHTHTHSLSLSLSLSLCRFPPPFSNEHVPL